MTMHPPTNHALLRGRRSWPGCALTGLTADGDGTLTLLRVPALTPATELPGPFTVVSSGVTAAGDGVVALCDTDGARLVVRDNRCDASWSLPGRPGGGFVSPTAVAAGPAVFAVADSGAGRVVLVSRPDLRVSGSVDGLSTPVAVQLLSDGGLIVLDTAPGGSTLRRFAGPRLDPDPGFAAAASDALRANASDPFVGTALGLSADDVLWLSSPALNELVRLASDGSWLEPVALVAGRVAGALAIGADLVAYADSACGVIVLIDAHDGAELATMAGFVGPVAGLAWTDEGSLLVKADGGPDLLVATPAARPVDHGWIVSGPLDAGVDLTWFRAFVETTIPNGAAVTLSVAQLDSAVVELAASDWVEAPAADVRLSLLDPSGGRRFLYLKADLTASARGASPELRQVAAHTERDGPDQHLPRAYRRADQSTGFLNRLLGHTATGLDHLERQINQLPTTIGPDQAPESALRWLAGWMALELPDSLDGEQWRELVPQAMSLHERRGSPASLRRLVQLETGADIELEEDFRHRHIWQLAAEPGSRLGFDTGLPAVVPHGLVLPDPQGLDPADRAADVETGSFTVGEAGALPAASWGTVLYGDTAHRFRVRVDQATACVPGLVAAVTAVLERERPAHTEFCVDVVGAELTVGDQAHVGIDAIVADGPQPGPLDTSLLGADLRLGGDPSKSTVADSWVVGRSTVPSPNGDPG